MESLSLIVTGEQGAEQWKALAESIQKLKNEYLGGFELLLVKPSGMNTEAFENDTLRGLAQKQQIIYIEKTGDGGEIAFIKEAAGLARFNYIAILDISAMNKSFNLSDLMLLCQKEFSENILFDLHFQNEAASDWEKAELRSAFVMPSNAARYLISALPPQAADLRSSLLYLAGQLELPVKNTPVHQVSPFDEALAEQLSRTSRKRSRRLAAKCKNSYNWFVRVPLQEVKQKPSWEFLAASGNSINRLIFATLAVILFVLMPVLSINTSISGDEDKHVIQAKAVYDFYATGGKDQSYMKDIWGPFYAYPISFDVLMHILIKTFKIDHIYEFRHIFNALLGWLAILFAGLLARRIAGWRAGIIAMLFLLITPSFLGHSYNNPKDIPFAFGYVFSLYYIFILVKEFPHFKRRTSILTALSIGVSLNVRSGGLLLIAYLGFFIGLAYLFNLKFRQIFSQEGIKIARKSIIYLFFIIISGYILGIIFWPYAIENPITGPLNALSIMTNFSVSLRQIFEGKFIWSDHVPWYYSLKYIFITVPLVVFLGLFFFMLLQPSIAKKGNRLWIFMIFFTFIFPVFWVIYQKSNVYGGWRHLLFAYTMLVVGSAVGAEAFLKLFRKKKLQYLAYIPFIGLAVNPTLHIIRNHPHEYIYYNEFIGGVDNAYGNYETDYYYHSMREACLWLKDKINSDSRLKNRKLIIATNFTPAASYYFRDMKDSDAITYVRYYDRGEYDWDYAIIANSYINPYQLRKNLFPPKNTIHTVNADDVPICAIIERKNKDDYIGTRELNEKKYDLAIATLKEAVAYDPANEVATLNLAKAYLETMKLDSSLLLINECLKVYPDYDKALNLMGITYLNKNDMNDAISVFLRITRVNPKYVSAYYNLGYVYKVLNDPNMAINYLKQAIMVNKNYTPSYYLLAEVLKSIGRNDEARQVLQLVKGN